MTRPTYLGRRAMSRMLRIMSLGLSCRELDARIPDFVDGHLPRLERVRVSVHLSICRMCRRYVTSYRRVVELTRSTLAEAEDEVPERVVRRILAAAPPDSG